VLLFISDVLLLTSDVLLFISDVLLFTSDVLLLISLVVLGWLMIEVTEVLVTGDGTEVVTDEELAILCGVAGLVVVVLQIVLYVM